MVGAFNQKVTVGKEGEAKAAQVRPRPARHALEIVLAPSGAGGAPHGHPPAPPSGVGSRAQLRPRLATRSPRLPALPWCPCLLTRSFSYADSSIALQGRPGVLTRRAAAQLAAAGNGNAQVCGGAASALAWIAASSTAHVLRPQAVPCSRLLPPLCCR